MEIRPEPSASDAAGFLLKGSLGIATGLAGSQARVKGSDLRVRAGVIEAIGDLRPLPGENRH